MLSKHIFYTGTTEGSTSIGLLILRVVAGLSLFLKHGREKLMGYSTMVQHFPNPIHIGAHASLAYALLSDGICSVLVVVGLATRPAAFIILMNVLTVFFLVHHAAFFSSGTSNWLRSTLPSSRRCSSPEPDSSVSVRGSSGRFRSKREVDTDYFGEAGLTPKT